MSLGSTVQDYSAPDESAIIWLAASRKQVWNSRRVELLCLQQELCVWNDHIRNFQCHQHHKEATIEQNVWNSLKLKLLADRDFFYAESIILNVVFNINIHHSNSSCMTENREKYSRSPLKPLYALKRSNFWYWYSNNSSFHYHSHPRSLRRMMWKQRTRCAIFLQYDCLIFHIHKHVITPAFYTLRL